MENFKKFDRAFLIFANPFIVKMSDENSFLSFILVGKVDDFKIRFNLLAWMKYIKYILVATNQDVLLFKLLTFWGVLLNKTFY